MYDMQKLAKLVKELEDQLVCCMRCGLCQAVCPVFAETGRETDVTRGKLALLEALTREMLKDPVGVGEHLHHCLLCGSCAANCPSGVKVLDIFIKARILLTGYLGLSPVKRLIFRGMLSHPGFFDRLLEWGACLQRVFIKPADNLLGTSCSRFWFPLGKRHFNALAAVPFHSLAGATKTDSGKSGIKVGFFSGCVIDKIFPAIGQAVVRSLDYHGIGLFLPQSQGCCGIPALSSGDATAFHRLVRHNLKTFASEPFHYLVTACATCTSTIKKLWPAMANGLTGEEQSQIRGMADKVMDISQFLVDVAGVDQVFPSRKDDLEIVSYHDPCHLRKSLGIAEQPRKLISANPRSFFREMNEADRCCGCGGSFNLEHYDMSASIGKRKRDNIIESQCSTVATSCPACILQISDMLSQAGDPVRVRHVIEIYADSLS
ncbi:MAG TPA: (Fe-S)-binding protein [Syntrophobacteraceae bacterium]|nr:(Fe-S)-binding protein [Syntrophobacteraceae bacterium]